jgi:putative transposase
MPRAKRYFKPNYVWHITDRCVNKEFLLRFKQDRTNWISWMYEAKKRFNISILNYAVTSNHIHCVVMNNANTNEIAKAMHLASGRTAQEYNERKNRHGSFWGDRYHATAVETGQHLINCIIYIDLNMVRAGEVSHPAKWTECGYKEISGEKRRFRLIDIHKLSALLGISPDRISQEYRQTISSHLENNEMKREKHWTESIAVGSKNFVERFREKLGIKARNSRIEDKHDSFLLTNKKES